jgi:hypothetical protein
MKKKLDTAYKTIQKQGAEETLWEHTLESGPTPEHTPRVFGDEDELAKAEREFRQRNPSRGNDGRKIIMKNKLFRAE